MGVVVPGSRARIGMATVCVLKPTMMGSRLSHLSASWPPMRTVTSSDAA